MKAHKPTSEKLSVICTALLLLYFTLLGPSLILTIENDKRSTPLPSVSEKVTETFEGCTSVIVTGSVVKGGGAILMKNRDTAETMTKPVYVPRQSIVAGNQTYNTYAYTAVNLWCMGINEKGLAGMNTYMDQLTGIGHGFAWDNGQLNQKILELCENVSQVATMLNDTYGIIGPSNRACATCIGVIDRFGNGAFFEVSPTEAYGQYIVNGYDSRANHPRIFPGKTSGPNGRDQYALDILNEIYTKKGVISLKDVVQNVSRYVGHMELSNSCFSILGHVCNNATQAAMVAASGDLRYDGKLNCMWGEYGNPPIVGLFVPSMVHAGPPSSILDSFWNYVWEKGDYAHGSCSSYYYNATRVREIQTYTFFAEDYSFQEYDDLIASIPDGLSDMELRTYLRNFVDDAVQVATNIYIQEPTVTDHTVVEEYHVTIVSNSTITDFNFSQTQKRISFNLTEPLNSSGFCYVIIPTQLLDGVFTITVGQDTYIVEEPPVWQQDSNLFNFTYTSPSQVKITGTTVVPEFGAGGRISLLTLTLFCTAITCLVYSIKTRKCARSFFLLKVLVCLNACKRTKIKKRVVLYYNAKKDASKRFR
jgi:hypothetical protein